MQILASASINIILKICKNADISPQEFIDKTGVEVNTITTPGYKIPLTTYNEAIRQISQMTNDNFFGFRYAESVAIEDLGLAGYILCSSKEVFDIILNYTYYQQLIGLPMNITMYTDKTTVKIIFTDKSQEPEFNRHYVDSSMGCLLKIINILSGQQVAVDKVHLTYNAPGRSDEYQRWYKAPVAFNQEENILFIKPAELKHHNKSADLLQSLLTKQADNLIHEHPNDNYYTNKIKKYLLSNSDISDLTLSQISSYLFISNRNLQLKLKKEGTTYKKILNTVKKERAEALLNNTQLPVTEIAYRLGFEEAASFNKAFKRWTGITPGQYQKREKLKFSY